MAVCTKQGAAIKKHCSMEEDIKVNDDNIRDVVEKEIKRLGKNANLNHIDVSAVTDMSALFNNLDFNGDIYLWDVSNVTDMLGMFANSTFDGDMSQWKIRPGINHEHCFDNSPLENQPDKQPKFNPLNQLFMNKVKHKRPQSENYERYHQIKDGMDQYKMAMQSGFYIEAIALMESAISDRMESTLNYLYPFMDYSYGTIGQLADALSKTNCYASGLLSEIKCWAKKRNNAIHQMMKLLPNQDMKFQERYDELEQCAKEGKLLFGKFENEHRKLKRYQEKHPLVFKLKDPSNNYNHFPEVLKIKCKVADVKIMIDDFLSSQNSYFESEDGVMWSKKLLDLYYDLETTK